MLLTVENLHSGYGPINVLTGAALVVEPGEIVGVLGRNGVGKTTLMRTLSGALPCVKGKIQFSGTDISSYPPHARAAIGIAYVPQGRQIFSQMSVQENMLVGAYAAHLDRQVIASRIDSLLADFPSLKPKLGDLGGSLSGGQQQLLALARALITQPKLLLLDEPSEGIQPSLLDDIVLVLERVASRDKVAILLVEQNLDFAGSLAARGYLMDSGRMHREIQMQGGFDASSISRELFGAAL